MARFVLDTNVVSQILRRNAAALGHLRESAESDDDLFMCPVVFYELWRGLRYRDAARQLTELKTFAGTLQWVEYNRAMWEDAAGLWAVDRSTKQLRDPTVKMVSGKLSDRLDAKLTAAARRHKTTKSALVRNALKAALRSVAKSERSSALDRVRDLVGCVVGPTDLSTNKRYLKRYGR